MREKGPKGKAEQAGREASPDVRSNRRATRAARTGGRPVAPPAEPAAERTGAPPSAGPVAATPGEMHRTRPARRPAPAAPAVEGRFQMATPPPPLRAPEPPGPREIVATAVQAAGEIAQIGLTLWGQAVKHWMDRLPRL